LNHHFNALFQLSLPCIANILKFHPFKTKHSKYSKITFNVLLDLYIMSYKQRNNKTWSY